jgi:hypothetical protein
MQPSPMAEVTVSEFALLHCFATSYHAVDAVCIELSEISNQSGEVRGLGHNYHRRLTPSNKQPGDVGISGIRERREGRNGS